MKMEVREENERLTLYLPKVAAKCAGRRLDSKATKSN
jgi:hypothetical protein